MAGNTFLYPVSVVTKISNWAARLVLCGSCAVDRSVVVRVVIRFSLVAGAYGQLGAAA